MGSGGGAMMGSGGGDMMGTGNGFMVSSGGGSAMMRSGNATMGSAGGSLQEWEEAVQLKVSTQKVSVPCTRNVYKSYTVKVPREVKEQIPRTVKYTEMETRRKTVPYTVNRSVVRYRDQPQTYQVPVTTPVTKMVSVTT